MATHDSPRGTNRSSRRGRGGVQVARVEVLEPRLLLDGTAVVLGPPAFTGGPDLVVGMDTAPHVVPGWASDLAAPLTEVAVASRFWATGADQPQLTAVLYDASGVIRDSSNAPMTFDPYIDTGASGFVISHLTAQGYTTTDYFGDETFVPGLGLGTSHGSVIGTYTDVGVGGPELGDVTSPLGLCIRNGAPLEGTFDWDTLEYLPPVVNLGEFNDVGSYNLWMRQQEGYGEHMMVMGFDMGVQPMDVVGMPVIEQSVMVMDPTTIGFDEETLATTRMDTQLLPKGSATPLTNVDFRLRLADFSGTAPPAGETFPSHASNPVFDHVAIGDFGGGVSTENTWLFDTGSTMSMVSFARAQEIGLIDPSYASFADFMDTFDGLTVPMGGIGSITEAVNAPILELGSVSIPDADGTVFTWQDVDVLVVDVAGLDGVFGLNLLLPASTIDMSGLTELGNNPGYFDKIVFDAHADQTADLRLMYAPEGGYTPPPPAVLSFQVTNDHNGLFSVQPSIAPDGTLTFTPASGAHGRATVTVTLTDSGGRTTGPLATSAPQTFTLSVCLPGDANADGIVDQADYTAWYNNYGAAGDFSRGDFTGDGLVDQADYTAWYNNYGAGGGAMTPASSGAASLDQAAGQTSETGNATRLVLSGASASAMQETAASSSEPLESAATTSVSSPSTTPAAIRLTGPVSTHGVDVLELTRRRPVTRMTSVAPADQGAFQDLFDALREVRRVC